YAEMIFGNTLIIREVAATVPQRPIHAIRTSRSIPLSEIVRKTGLAAAEVKRFNPALVSRVPAGATLYLPHHEPAFGIDVSFWHRPPSLEYATVLADFLGLRAPLEDWNDPAFRWRLTEF